MDTRVQKICSEIGTVIIGKDEIIRRVLMAFLSEGHILLEDVPGTGKTTLAMTAAKVLGLDSRRVQFNSDTMPSDIIGFSVYDHERKALVYQEGAIMTNLLLADEINRTSSKTQSALLEAMQERRVTVDGNTYALPTPFIVIATQNPAGSAGTQMLPNAQLDRFLVRLAMGYPSRESQIDIMKNRQTADPLDACSAVVSHEEFMEMVKAVRQIHVSDRIYEYITDLVEKTRLNPYVELGVSPRGGIAVCRMAKAAAFVNGRDYVTPADVREIFTDVCAHRLILSPQARLHEQRAEAILGGVLRQVKSPDVAELSL
ncbi:MAG: MoxR family ATPase [Lachnospiraceae bacterium]|nr:MoxR family ATPase [Lachnospiraceae bacterium]